MQKPYLVVFYKEAAGKEPVRVWLKDLDKQERHKIGEELQTLQFHWPIGMPLVRPLGKGLHELRVRVETRIMRVIFTVNRRHIILLHGFVKKTEQISQGDLELARMRLKKVVYEKDIIYGYA